MDFGVLLHRFYMRRILTVESNKRIAVYFVLIISLNGMVQ